MPIKINKEWQIMLGLCLVSVTLNINPLELKKYVYDPKKGGINLKTKLPTLDTR